MTAQTSDDHVCAQTHPTAAQRRAALIADATVAANATFGREAIAALPRHWHADDQEAELRFTVGKHECWLTVTARWPFLHWRVTLLDTLRYRLLITPPDMVTADAAEQLRAALDELRAEIADTGMPHLSTVFDAIRAERERQNATWGQQDHDPYTWLAILSEEVGELSQAILHDTFGGKAAGTMCKELVQLVAVGVQWLECLERQTAHVQIDEVA